MACIKRYRGILIWDFDGVLFETERYKIDWIRAYVDYGIRENIILDVLRQMRSGNEYISMSGFIRGLRGRNIALSVKAIHGINDHNLKSKEYYSPQTDATLHRMKKYGFTQLIVSMGSSSYQRKKMFVGCGIGFRRHFTKIIVTPRHKYLTISKIKKEYPGVPCIFIDDTKENLDLVKRHVPGVKTMHYSNVSGGSLAALEKEIVSYAKKHKKENS